MVLLAPRHGGQMDQDQGVGRQVKMLREAKGWSQTKLAVEASMSVSGISMIENGHRNLSTVTLAKLAEALGVEVRDLFPLEQAPLPELEEPEGFDAWVWTLEQYKSLRAPISNFEKLDPQERHRIFADTWELFQPLREVYDPADSDLAWEAGLLLDALYQSLLRMISVYELEQERGAAGADVVNISEYKARLEQLSA
jgi:transcriptional regulator with XRE-family HTH domain